MNFLEKLELPISEGAKKLLLRDVFREAVRRSRYALPSTGFVVTKRYREFQEKYVYDPVNFVLDCIKWDKGKYPTDYQLEILGQVVERGRASVRGPRGLGKTAMLSWIVHWFALTRDFEDWKIPTTASSWPQLSKFLWPEIHKWARALRWNVIGRPPYDMRTELLMLRLRLSSGEAFAISHERAELMEGAHADHILYLFDEGKSIKDEIFDSAEGSLATGTGDQQEAFALAFSTPGEPVGRFYDIQSRKAGFEDWWVRKVTKEEAIKAGRISRAWVNARRRQWGESSVLFQNHVEGEFASSGMDTVISLPLVEAAISRWYEVEENNDWGDFIGLGVDVGRGGDKSTIGIRHEAGIKEIRMYSDRDTMAIVGYVKGILNAYNNVGTATIDVIGIGAGVVDRLREQEFSHRQILAFNAGSRSDRTDKSGEIKFLNARSAAWWHMRELLEEGIIALPPDDLLIGDLVTPKWKMTSTGKVAIEGKEDIRKRISRSTDSADCVIQAYFDEELVDSADMLDLGTVEDYVSPWR